jgi:hypothetical protein
LAFIRSRIYLVNAGTRTVPAGTALSGRYNEPFTTDDFIGRSQSVSGKSFLALSL